MSPLLFLLIAVPVTFVVVWYVLDMLLSPVPHISTRTKAIRSILPLLQINARSVVYDLGCGNGRVLRIIAREHPEARVIGIEHGLITYIQASLLSFRKNITLRRENIFTADIADATHVYLYLLPHVLKKLEPLLQEKLKPGTRIVSIDFPLHSFDLEKVITLPVSLYSPLSRKVYIYTL